MRSFSVREFRDFVHIRRRCFMGVSCFMWCTLTDRWHANMAPHRSRQFGGLDGTLGFDEELSYALQDLSEDRSVMRPRVRAELSTGYNSMLEEDSVANVPEMEDNTEPAAAAGTGISASLHEDVSILEEPPEPLVIQHEVPAAQPVMPQPVRLSLMVYGVRIRSPCGLSQLNVDFFDPHGEAYQLSDQLAQELQFSMNRGAFEPNTSATMAAIIEQGRARRNLGINLRAAAGPEVDLSQLHVDIHNTMEAYVDDLFELLQH